MRGTPALAENPAPKMNTFLSVGSVISSQFNSELLPAFLPPRLRPRAQNLPPVRGRSPQKLRLYGPRCAPSGRVGWFLKAPGNPAPGPPPRLQWPEHSSCLAEFFST